jgi:hypothetical protein
VNKYESKKPKKGVHQKMKKSILTIAALIALTATTSFAETITTTEQLPVTRNAPVYGQTIIQREVKDCNNRERERDRYDKHDIRHNDEKCKKIIEESGTGIVGYNNYTLFQGREIMKFSKSPLSTIHISITTQISY